MIKVPSQHDVQHAQLTSQITHYGPASTVANLRGRIYVCSRAMYARYRLLANEGESIYGNQITIYANRNLTGGFRAHSRHSDCLKSQTAKGGSRPLQSFERQLYLIDISQMAASPAANTPEPKVLRRGQATRVSRFHTRLCIGFPVLQPRIR